MSILVNCRFCKKEPARFDYEKFGVLCCNSECIVFGHNTGTKPTQEEADTTWNTLHSVFNP